MSVRERFDHVAWTTAVATFVSYGLILLFLFVLLFVVPFLVYSQAFA